MDIQQFAQQLRGKKFGGLVLAQCKNEQWALQKALDGTAEKLPEDSAEPIWDWIEETLGMLSFPGFWARDCGHVFLEICHSGEVAMENLGFETDDDDLFNLFQCCVLLWAILCTGNREIFSYVKKETNGGLLQRIFS